MPLLKVNPTQRIALAIATALALLAAFWFLQNYIILIILSAIAVVLFNPVYNWFLKRGMKRGRAATLTFVVSVFSVIIPLLIIALITVYQINQLVQNVSAGNYSTDISEIGSQIIDALNQLFIRFNIPITLTVDSVAQAVSAAAAQFGKVLLEGLVSWVGGLFAFITTAIIYIYVFISMLVHQNKIIDTAKKLNPLGDEISQLYIARISAMTKATVRGQFIIAVCQGTASAVVLALTGFPDLFFFFWMLLTVLSIVPLGAGIVTIPIGILMMLTGNVVGGAIVILNHLIIVTNIDNVLRPRLVPREAKLDSALMILAVFAGLALLGFIGIVIGPVLMIILVTTVQIYLEVFRETESIDTVSGAKKRNGIIKKAKFWAKTG